MSVYDVSGNIIAQSDTAIANDFYIGSDLIRKPLRLTKMGTIKYLQAFCMYNGNYYSTNGSRICEQDSNFNQLRDVALAVGHGNSFQLGSNGHAYVSGWDDNKVYDVNLSTLTIANTISLPTTGYTTAIVDDVKKLVYIWQRDSYPITEEYYNFITYNYETQQTISTVVTTEKFAAMQSVDACMDLALVLNGGGSASMPNGYRVFDKNGKIVGKLFIGSKATEEPEGVFIDRTTQEIYMSFINRDVYKIIF